jgi:hypothetical protein
LASCSVRLVELEKKEVSGPAGESYEKAAALFTATLTREKAAWKPRFSWKAHPWENTAKTGFCPDWKANFVAQFFRIFYNLSELQWLPLD